MIYTKDHEITSIYFKGKAISTIYYLGKIAWEAVKSCFGSGYWVNKKAFIKKEHWKNG